MTTLAISDTNIFIDLIEAELLDCFFELPYSIATTDFVINELLEPSEKSAVE